MLNKELLMRNTGGQQPVALTVGRRKEDYGFYTGMGSLVPVPVWAGYVQIETLAYFGQEDFTICHSNDRSYTFVVYVSGYGDAGITSGESISGDPFRFTVKVGQTVYLTFDPPPYRISLRKSSRYLPALERRAW